jgi:hypothetical protein
MEVIPKEVIVDMCLNMELHDMVALLTSCKHLATLLEVDRLYMAAVTQRNFTQHNSWKETAKLIREATYTVSIAVCGSARTGKSSIIRRHTTGDWSMKYNPSKVTTQLQKYFGGGLLELTEYPGGMQPQRDHDIMWYLWGGMQDGFKLQTKFPTVLFFNLEMLGIRTRAQINAAWTKMRSLPVEERHEVHAQSMYNWHQLMDSTKRVLKL